MHDDNQYIVQLCKYDLLTLQDGVNIDDKVHRGTLTVVSADNLASQLIGGYKALNSAFRKCRYCMATDKQMQSKVSIIICNITFRFRPTSRYSKRA